MVPPLRSMVLKKQLLHAAGGALMLVTTTGVLALASCKDSGSEKAAAPTGGLMEPPLPPGAEVATALSQQPMGRKLDGLINYLVRGNYVRASLPKAPRYYLLNFSGST